MAKRARLEIAGLSYQEALFHREDFGEKDVYQNCGGCLYVSHNVSHSGSGRQVQCQPSGCNP